MLALEVAFLMGRYSASDFRDREHAEWPPHPSRLFSALVAAAHESGLGESARAALLWLESLPAPSIRADVDAQEQTPFIVYVPVNDPSGPPLPQRTERQPRSFPSVVPRVEQADVVPTVHFIWPTTQPDSLLKSLLEEVAGNVTYLGSSRSLVRVRLLENPPEPNWFPDTAGDTVLRVPTKGRLENLELHFQNGLRPPAGTFQRYRCGAIPPKPQTPESIYGEMVTYRLGGPISMESQTTLKLTDVLRAAAMRCSQESAGTVPEVLSGHFESGKPAVAPHACYVALPFVSDTQAHADGRILGLAVVLPRRISSEARRQAVRALTRINHLMVPGVGRLELERLSPDQVAPYNLQSTTWVGPRRRWASVTPVLLDRFPKKGNREVEDIIAGSCESVGLPRPTEVVVDRHSPLHGVEPSFRFVVRRQKAGNTRLHTHILLSFEQEVQGPILLGAGRHFGLGLLRPLDNARPFC